MRIPLAALIALAACGQTVIEDDDGSHEASYTTGTGLTERGDRRMYWGWTGLVDYSFTQGGHDGNEPSPDVRVTVRGNAVVGGVYVTDGTAVPAAGLADLYTIDGLFDLIDREVQGGAYTIDITYDRARSFPTLVQIDRYRDTADDERWITAEQLVDDSDVK